MLRTESEAVEHDPEWIKDLFAERDALRARVAELEDAMRDLLNYAEKQTCLHEETHRAGAIWEICDMCGRKWADDRGGKPEYEEPEAFTKAHALLGVEGK